MLLSQADAYTRPHPQDIVWLFVFAIAVFALFVTLSVNAAVRHKTADSVQTLLTMFGTLHRVLNGVLVLFVAGIVIISARQSIGATNQSSVLSPPAQFALLIALVPIVPAVGKAFWCLTEVAAFCFLAWRHRIAGQSRISCVRASLKHAALARHDLGPIRRTSYKLADRTLSLIDPSTQ